MAKLIKSKSIFIVTIAFVYVCTLEGYNCLFHCTGSDVKNVTKDDEVAITIYCTIIRKLNQNDTVEWSKSNVMIGKCVYSHCSRDICCWDCSLAHRTHGKYFKVFPGCSGFYTLIIKQQASNETTELINDKYYISLNNFDKTLAFDMSVDETDKNRISTECDNLTTSYTGETLFSQETTSLSASQTFLHNDRGDEFVSSLKTKTTESAYSATNDSSPLDNKQHVNKNLPIFVILAVTILCCTLLCVYIIRRKITDRKNKQISGSIYLREQHPINTQDEIGISYRTQQSEISSVHANRVLPSTDRQLSNENCNMSELETLRSCTGLSVRARSSTKDGNGEESVDMCKNHHEIIAKPRKRKGNGQTEGHKHKLEEYSEIESNRDENLYFVLEGAEADKRDADGENESSTSSYQLEVTGIEILHAGGLDDNVVYGSVKGKITGRGKMDDLHNMDSLYAKPDKFLGNRGKERGLLQPIKCTTPDIEEETKTYAEGIFYEDMRGFNTFTENPCSTYHPIFAHCYITVHSISALDHTGIRYRLLHIEQIKKQLKHTMIHMQLIWKPLVAHLVAHCDKCLSSSNMTMLRRKYNARYYREVKWIL